MTNHLLPNLSERRPKRVIEMTEQVVQMIEKRLALSLGPRTSGQTGTQDDGPSLPMSALIAVMIAAGGEKAQ